MTLPADFFAFARSGYDADSESSGRFFPKRGNRLSNSLVISPPLVARIQAREVDAYRELVRTVYGPLVRFARSIVDSRDDAEDVVQDVLTVVWDLGPRWSPTGDPVAYLFASVRNHALNEIRRRMRAEQREQEAHRLDRLMPDATQAGPLEHALHDVVEAEENAARIQRVSAVLETLTERQRTAYELRYRRGLSIAAVAEVLGSTPKAAEHLTARVARMVLERLREGLDPL